MLKKLTGYFLGVIGAIGSLYFKNYKGSAIPYPTLSLFACIAVGAIGIYLVYLAVSNSLSKQEKYNRDRLNRLKQKGEKIFLTLDTCEIRENNYYEEAIDESGSRVQVIDALYDPNRNHQQKYIEQSAIIYHYKTGNKNYRMVSQSFALNAKVLANHVENKRLALYVSRFDKSEYAFEMTK